MTLPRATSTPSATSLLDVWSDCVRLGLETELLASLSFAEIETIATHWATFARPDQVPPEAAQGGAPWTVWLVLGGRGAGKTRTGAEWVRGVALGRPPFAREPAGRIALVGEDFAAVREVMVEGASGLLAIHPRHERPKWEPSRRRLVWPNGAQAHAFSAEDPESLRGPQFGAAWLDEVAKWKRAAEAWDMLQFGLRLGERPRQVVTTTPRPVALIKRLLADPLAAVSRASTRANAFNLAPSFLDAVVGRYAGTRLGRQEIDGELIEERSDALWSRALLEGGRVAAAPALARIVVGVDPPASSGRRADSCGIVGVGIAADGHLYVLADATLGAARPAGWAAAALSLWRRLEADCLVVETNQGGEMAEAVLREADPGVPVLPVRATRGKAVRAEPVALLYEKARVHHVGTLPALEDELCDFGPGPDGFGLSSGRSPDRLDALVWAVTLLALQPAARPKVRRL